MLFLLEDKLIPRNLQNLKKKGWSRTLGNTWGVMEKQLEGAPMVLLVQHGG